MSTKKSSRGRRKEKSEIPLVGITQRTPAKVHVGTVESPLTKNSNGTPFLNEMRCGNDSIDLEDNNMPKEDVEQEDGAEGIVIQGVSRISANTVAGATFADNANHIRARLSGAECAATADASSVAVEAEMANAQEVAIGATAASMEVLFSQLASEFQTRLRRIFETMSSQASANPAPTSGRLKVQKQKATIQRLTEEVLSAGNITVPSNKVGSEQNTGNTCQFAQTMCADRNAVRDGQNTGHLVTFGQSLGTERDSVLRNEHYNEVYAAHNSVPTSNCQNNLALCADRHTVPTAQLTEQRLETIQRLLIF